MSRSRCRIGAGRCHFLLAVLLGLVAALAPGAAAAGPKAPVTNWVLTGSKSFMPVAGDPAICGSQGLVSDGNSLWFSWNFGFSHNDLDLTRTITNRCNNAIPPALYATGHNHIGDIDMYRGIIYAPIEDGSEYLSPWIALYRARDLSWTGTAYELDREYLTEGVPWVAVDGPRGLAYTAEAHNTTLLNVHRLSDFRIIRTVRLDQEVPDIQGAKMFRGLLYYSQDNGPRKSIGALDPDTGHVTNLFDRDLGNRYEAEGLTFIRRPSGTELAALELYRGTTGDPEDPFSARLQRYRINGDTTPPVLKRLQVRPRRVSTGRRGTIPRRVKVRVRSSEPAVATGRWLRCAGPKQKPCHRQRALGRPFRQKLAAGSNRFRLKIAAGQGRLRPGRWRLRLTPVDEADITGRPARAALTVRPPRKRP